MKCNLKNKCQYVQTFGTCIAEEGRICECFERQPTNADRIRAMSDEELAENMSDWQWWGGGLDPKDWLEWLKQPTEQKSYKKIIKSC